MQDGDHEGHPSLRIEQIMGYMDDSGSSKPNVYLINAGTNDAQQNFKMDEAVDRLSDMMSKAWSLSEKATIIVSTLLPSYNELTSPGAHLRAAAFNTELRARVPTLKRDGRRIVLADMDDVKSIIAAFCTFNISRIMS